MKNTLIILATLSLFTRASAYSHHQQILLCESPSGDGPTYALEQVNEPDSALRYRLTRTGPSGDQLYLDVPVSNTVIYGDTVMASANRGRSGYYIFYHSHHTTLIDINIFRGGEINTPEPLTNYVCH
jgi:hypothetical protein